MSTLRRDDRIHELRLKTKRVRALLALKDGEQGRGRDTTAAELRLKHTLRSIAHRVARERDITVAEARLKELAREKACPVPKLPRAKRLSDRELRESEKRLISVAERALPLEERKLSDPQATYRALARSFRCTRKRYRKACRTFEAADVHEWRKRLKALQYQLETVSRPESSKLVRKREERIKRLKGLARLLGDAHDFQVAISLLAGSMNDVRLRKAVTRCERKLQRRALEKGRRLFRSSCRRWLRPWENLSVDVTQLGRDVGVVLKKSE